MVQTGCMNDCYTDLSFMGVAFDPNCDIELCNYLYNHEGECYAEDDCCC